MEREIQAFLHSSWLARLRRNFSLVDTDADGLVSAADLVAALTRLGLQVPQAWAVEQLVAYDDNDDGKVSFADYAAGMVLAHKQKEPAAEALVAAFHEIDSDDDGRITIDELAAFYRWRGVTLSPTEIADRIQPWDHDGDGKIDLGEMVHMLVG